MKFTIILLAAALFVIAVFLPMLSYAQAAEPIVAPSSILFDVWTIVQPLIVLVGSIVGPAFATWISLRIVSVLKLTDEKRKLEIEAQLRDALHQSAANALKFALAKARITAIAPGLLTASMVADAAAYVAEKNPDAISRLNVNGDALRDIILSKAPDILGAGVKVQP